MTLPARPTDPSDSDAGRVAVGVDVGGTTIKAVLARSDGSIVAERRCDTPTPDPTGEGVVSAVAELVAELSPGRPVPTGVVVPGIVDETTGTAVLSANLGWRDLPMRDQLGQRLATTVAFGHDVRAGGLAEARWGAARDAAGEVTAFVPIGTGIAAAILLGDRAVVSGGWAGEIGQVVLSSGPFEGERMERIASASAIARRAGCASAREVVELMASGHVRARQVWRDAITVLADSLAVLTATIGPRLIVIGGGLAGAGDLLLGPLARDLSDRLGPLRTPTLRLAALGDRAAALGAAALAFDQNQELPESGTDDEAVQR